MFDSLAYIWGPAAAIAIVASSTMVLADRSPKTRRIAARVAGIAFIVCGAALGLQIKSIAQTDPMAGLLPTTHFPVMNVVIGLSVVLGISMLLLGRKPRKQ